MRVSMRGLLAAGAACLLSAAMAAPASADFLDMADGFAGNTRMFDFSLPGPTNRVSGLISFAVYENTDGDWTDDAAFAATTARDFEAGSVNAAADFVYMYQVFNDTLTLPVIRELQVRIKPGSVNGSGYLDADNTTAGGTVFEDLAGSVGTSANKGFGTLDDVDGPLGLGNAPYVELIQPVDLTESALALNPLLFDVTLDPNFAVFTWGAIGSQGDGAIPAQRTSSVVFFTSNIGPAYALSHIVDSGSTANGRLPTTTPEPGSLIALLAGGPMLGLAAWRRRRKAA